MKVRLGKSLLGVAASALLATAAMAADLPPASPVAGPPPPPMAAPAFDWSGPYIGISGGYLFCSVCLSSRDVGLEVGYDLMRGRLLYGLSAELGLWQDIGTYVAAEIDARLGLALGRALLYAEVGYLAFINAPARYFVVGGGAELGIGTSASLFAELDAYLASAAPLIWHVSAGLRWRPGN